MTDLATLSPHDPRWQRGEPPVSYKDSRWLWTMTAADEPTRVRWIVVKEMPEWTGWSVAVGMLLRDLILFWMPDAEPETWLPAGS